MQRLAVLGSTGSIGRNTLQVAREMGDGVAVVALAAGSNVEELLRQALEFRPALLSVADESSRDRLWARFREQPSLNGYRPEVLTGPAGNLATVTAVESDTVVSAAVGVAGLAATFEAVRRGRRVALANKEVLVAAGELVMAEAARSGAELLPVDSEHNAVHQCLRAGRRDEVERLFLTASGGPFRNTPAAEFERITPTEALNHPTWKMGRRITIDSATLMNKGFEVIEACHLFAFPPAQVDVLVHPQSIVHSLIEFCDGSVIAQLAPPDMKLPIRYALSYPRRERCDPGRRLRWSDVRQLEFGPPDLEKFRLLKLAYEVLDTGGAAGCVLNAADEIAVEAFLDSRISFPAIAALVEETLQRTASGSVSSIEALLELDQRARREARQWIERAAVVSGTVSGS
jgi:1-deoxy-D-xylulose-5-phosphate reductoisomerase